MTSNNVRQTLEVMLGHVFNGPNLPWEALQAAGSQVRFIGNHPLPDGNKRLAIVGDTVAKLVLCEAWFTTIHPRGKSSDLGDQKLSLTNIKAQSKIESARYFRMPTLTA